MKRVSFRVYICYNIRKITYEHVKRRKKWKNAENTHAHTQKKKTVKKEGKGLLTHEVRRGFTCPTDIYPTKIVLGRTNAQHRIKVIEHCAVFPAVPGQASSP